MLAGVWEMSSWKWMGSRRGGARGWESDIEGLPESKGGNGKSYMNGRF